MDNYLTLCEFIIGNVKKKKKKKFDETFEGEDCEMEGTGADCTTIAERLEVEGLSLFWEAVTIKKRKHLPLECDTRAD